MVVQGDQAATPERSPTPLLDRISSPADLKTLPLSQLSALAAETALRAVEALSPARDPIVDDNVAERHEPLSQSGG